MAAYSATSDLLTGNIPTPAALSPQKYVDDAADEIDSKIGFLYQTPIDVTGTSAVPRPARLLLKRINNFIASGRLLMAAAAAQEDNQLHAYAWSLVKEGTLALDQIANGTIPIEGAVKLDTGDEGAVTAIIINNIDSESNVEAYYDRIANPFYSYGYGESERAPIAGIGVVR